MKSPLVIATRKRSPARWAHPALLAALMVSGCASRSQFQKGYDRGAGDTVKRQYWILQNLQKRQEPPRRQNPRLSYYRLPVEPDPEAPVKTVPYEIAIPIHE
jgi:hypothetical protein